MVHPAVVQNWPVTAEIELDWPEKSTPGLHRDMHRVAHAVSSLGGAIGWPVPPEPEETAAWLDTVMAEVAAGDAALCVARVDGVVQGSGSWRRDPAPVFRHSADITKIMAHPDARGLGLGRLITSALVDHSDYAGIETLRLGVRGNNHLAIAIYEQVGFVEWGRLPNVIEVGDLRFDDVRMYRRAPRPPHVVWRGSDTGGPGSSPRPARHVGRPDDHDRPDDRLDGRPGSGGGAGPIR